MLTKSGMMNLGRLMLGAICLMAIHCTAQNHEGYIALGTTLDFYHTDIDAIKGFAPYGTIKGGYEILKSTDDRRSLVLEVAYSGRRYNMDFGTTRFRYYFNGLEVSAFGGYNFAERWNAEAGAAVFFYYGTLASDNIYARFAGDFRTFDAMLLGGINYRFATNWSVGSRFKLGLIPMLEHTPISDFGELLPSKTDILARTLEFTIRLYIP